VAVVAARLEPMLATLVDRLPEPRACPGGCRYEPKWDGYRALAQVDEYRGVTLVSRRAKSLTAAFPELVHAVYEVCPPRTVVDGEIVRWADGRLDFAALQRRNSLGVRRARELAQAEPCHYIAFDLLRLEGRDLSGAPLSERRAALEQLLADVPGTCATTLGLHTDDVELARSWFDALAPLGVEGVVVKAAADRYRPGVRAWQKVKHYATTEFVVGGVIGDPARPGELILGRYASATRELRVAGRTVPLHPSAAVELGAALTPAGEEHPWPVELPPSWHSRTKEPTAYTRVVPELVVEARVDAATLDGERWRHGARYLRIRADLSPEDVPTDLDLEA
jgi:ATP-dependent DNA ligase